jgi:hypothetical protein
MGGAREGQAELTTGGSDGRSSQEATTTGGAHD